MPIDAQPPETRASVCPLDCPDRCSLSVEIRTGPPEAPGREEIGIVRGTDRNPLTAVGRDPDRPGAPFICEKVRDSRARVHGPRRVLHPWIRAAPKDPAAIHAGLPGAPAAQFRPATWEEAMERVADRISQDWRRDPGSVLPCWYGGSNGYLTGGGMDQRLWHALGVARIERTLCAANAGAAARALYGGMASADPLDLHHAQTVVLWGMNPHASGIHLIPMLKGLKARGGRLIVVDPRRTPAAAMADLHLQPLPGTDVALAMALHHLAFAAGYADQAALQAEAEAAGVAAFMEAAAGFSPWHASVICDVPEAQIREFAALYARGRPALVRCGWGPERNRNGADAIRAVLALPAVYGKFGVRGGGYVMSTSSGYRADAARFQRVQDPAPPAARPPVNQSRLAAALEGREEFAGQPAIRSLYVYNCNPAATFPDQVALARALARPDLFTVVHEQVWTDTCDLADVVLPATTFFEHREVSRSYGGYLLQYAAPVIDPVGEARPNHAVCVDLAARLAARGLPTDRPELREPEEELARRITDAVPAASGRWEELRRDRVIRLPSPVQFVDTRPDHPAPAPIPADPTDTPADPAPDPRRIWLHRDEAGREIGAPTHRPPPVDGDLPLILISPADRAAITSTGFESLPPGSARVALCPEDAAERGIGGGEEIEVWNPRGRMRAIAAVDPDLRRGVASCPKGLWRRATRDGWTANALAPDHVDPVGGGACYNDARVEIRKVTLEPTG